MLEATDADLDVVGTGAELLMDADAAGRAIVALESIEVDLGLRILEMKQIVAIA